MTTHLQTWSEIEQQWEEQFPDFRSSIKPPYQPPYEIDGERILSFFKSHFEAAVEEARKAEAENCVEHAAKWIQKMVDEGLDYQVISRAATLTIFANELKDSNPHPEEK